MTKQPRADTAGTVRVLPVACKVVRIQPMAASSSTLEYDMQQTRAKAGITHGSEERAPSPHSLRKFLQTALDVSGVNTTMSNVVLGHSNAIREHYSGSGYLDIAEIREAYQSAVEKISVTGSDVDPATVTSLQNKVLEEETTNKALLSQLKQMDTRLKKLEVAEKGVL